jgi:hypothetical protein
VKVNFIEGGGQDLSRLVVQLAGKSMTIIFNQA